MSRKSLKGQLLLDSGRLQGSFFQRTVVLVCHHDAEGAVGLVLNRPTGSSAGDTVLAEVPESLKTAPLYLGGPVQSGALSYLLTDSFVPDANVMPNLTIGHSLETLVELTREYAPAQQIKLFAGYSGWGAGQLEDEMKRDAWITHPASLELVFETPPEQLWKKILGQKGWEYKLLSQMPEDLSAN
jgi:putative transcriptional regulator